MALGSAYRSRGAELLVHGTAFGIAVNTGSKLNSKYDLLIVFIAYREYILYPAQ